MANYHLPGNPHNDAANYADIDAAPYAIAQATLALAYEQRTANLIAIMADSAANGGLAGVDEGVVWTQIMKRVGLQ